MLGPVVSSEMPAGPRRRAYLRTALATTALSSIILVGLTIRAHDPFGPSRKAPAATATLALDPALLDPRPALGPDGRWAKAPLPSEFRRAPGGPVAPLASAAPAPAAAAAVSAPSPVVAEPPRTVAVLPPPRPPEFRVAAAAPAPRVTRGSRRTRVAAAPPADNRSFFEKLFDLQPSSGPAYAALDSGPVASEPKRQISALPAPVVSEAGTAIYDISARTVTLPNGERLEAHSGLREKMDDPRFVHVRMRGATPPGTYDLTEREALFHGVRAIRLNPVGGSAAIHGRTGILAHSYLLGPNGDSNGCVSFRDYDKFLQAYLRGEIRRLIVVAGRGWDGPTNRRFGKQAEPAARGGDA